MLRQPVSYWSDTDSDDNDTSAGSVSDSESLDHGTDKLQCRQEEDIKGSSYKRHGFTAPCPESHSPPAFSFSPIAMEPELSAATSASTASAAALREELLDDHGNPVHKVCVARRHRLNRSLPVLLIDQADLAMAKKRHVTQPLHSDGTTDEASVSRTSLESPMSGLTPFSSTTSIRPLASATSLSSSSAITPPMVHETLSFEQLAQNSRRRQMPLRNNTSNMVPRLHEHHQSPDSAVTRAAISRLAYMDPRLNSGSSHAVEADHVMDSTPHYQWTPGRQPCVFDGLQTTEVAEPMGRHPAATGEVSWKQSPSKLLMPSPSYFPRTPPTQSKQTHLRSSLVAMTAAFRSTARPTTSSASSRSKSSLPNSPLKAHPIDLLETPPDRLPAAATERGSKIGNALQSLATSLSTKTASSRWRKKPSLELGELYSRHEASSNRRRSQSVRTSALSSIDVMEPIKATFRSQSGAQSESFYDQGKVWQREEDRLSSNPLSLPAGPSHISRNLPTDDGLFSALAARRPVAENPATAHNASRCWKMEQTGSVEREHLIDRFDGATSEERVPSHDELSRLDKPIQRYPSAQRIATDSKDLPPRQWL